MNTVVYKVTISNHGCACPFILIVLFLHLAGCSPNPDAELLTEVPWALTSPPLIIDTHTHTRYSDGRYPVTEVVQRAIRHGCDALAITDHTDLTENAATPDYFSAIAESRAQHPELILFGGVEWNVPPYDGREHVTVLVDPAAEQDYLTRFKALFEETDVGPTTAIAWLGEHTGPARSAVLIYNHPSRKDKDLNENLIDLLDWREGSDMVIGFEGAPGHQKAANTGSYTHRFRTRDRWDPVAEEIGGIWDQMLDRGHNIWAALAVSDFHNEELDYSPCEFARTHVYPDGNTASGILAGLRAGSFWADHGRILDDLAFALSIRGLPLPLTPGETVRIRDNNLVQLTINLKRGPGAVGAGLVVELIGNGLSGYPELIAKSLLNPKETSANWTLTGLKPGADKHSTYFRVRVRKPLADVTDLMAYTNPIRVVVR